jgi:hypothetical protein
MAPEQLQMCGRPVDECIPRADATFQTPQIATSEGSDRVLVGADRPFALNFDLALKLHNRKTAYLCGPIVEPSSERKRYVFDHNVRHMN